MLKVGESQATQTSKASSSPTLQGLCQQVLRSSSTRPQLLASLADVLVKVVRPEFVVHVARTADGEASIDGLLYPAEGLSEPFRNAFRMQGEAACRTGVTQLTRLGRPPNILLIAVPIVQKTGAYDALAAIFTAPTTTPDILTAVLELVAGHVALWDARAVGQSTEELAEAATAVLDLVGRMQGKATLDQAADTLLEELSAYLDVDSLALTRCTDSTSPTSRLVASTWPPQAELTELLEAVAMETLIRGNLSMWPPGNSPSQHSLLTFKQLAQHVGARRTGKPTHTDHTNTVPSNQDTSHTAVVCVPLKSDAMTQWGALIAWGDKSLLDPPDAVRFLEAAATPLAQTLSMVERGQRSRWQQRWSKLRTSAASATGKLWMAVVVALCCVMMIPLPYQIECECVVEPVVRRFVSAPFDATLDRTHVKTGDVVEVGTVLASLDGREIHWEQSGVLADMHRVQKERDGHLAAGRFGDAEIAKFQLEGLALKRELLQHRAEHLEIRSPVTGIILRGDLEETVGAPLKTGQTLFEIAPLNEMLLEVRIPEAELAYVRREMPVEVVLDAYPGRRWTSAVEHVEPRAEIVDDDHVFVSELKLNNELDLLRPGMHGRVWIRSDAHPLAWNLLHRGWERVLMWIGL